jgi:raffinose/stachyose/melibiose transport system permease protein
LFTNGGRPGGSPRRSIEVAQCHRRGAAHPDAVAPWNGYLLPLVVLDSESRYPWTLGLMAFQGQYNTSWQLVLAFITLTILPAIIMFLMAQRYIVAGLTAGALKG